MSVGAVLCVLKKWRVWGGVIVCTQFCVYTQGKEGGAGLA